MKTYVVEMRTYVKAVDDAEARRVIMCALPSLDDVLKERLAEGPSLVSSVYLPEEAK